MAKAGVVITRFIHAIAAVEPSVTIAIVVDIGPASNASFEVVGEVIDGSTTIALEDDVGTVGGRGVHRVGLARHVIDLVVIIVISHGSEARVVGLPADRTLPATVQSLANDQHVAVAVPSEVAGIEHELVPFASHGQHVGAGIDEGHTSGGVRGGGQFAVAHIGHPNADAILGRGAGGRTHIPAQARHRGGGHTSLGQLGSEEEVLTNGVVPQGVEGEIGRGGGRSLVTNHGFEAATGGTAAIGAGASVVVIGHGAAFAFKALTIESHLAVFTLSDAGVQHDVLVKHEFVDGIVAFRNLGERQGVVIVKLHVVSRLRHFHKGEGSGLFASQFPNIRDFGSVKLNHDRPDVGGTVTFGDGHELTLDDTGVGSVDIHNQLNAVRIHLEGQFFAFNAEHTVTGREVQNIDGVGGAFAVHGECEGFHPSAGRANTQVQAVDDFFFTFHVFDVQLVFHAAATTAATTSSIGESGLGQEVTLRGGNAAQAAVVVALN